MRRFLHYAFNRDNLLVMVFVLLLAFVVSNIPVNIEILNPIEEAFSDFDLTDIYFSRIKNAKETDEKTGGISNAEQADNRITVVNIGYLSREEIGRMIHIINNYHPKVIGIDAFFGSFWGEEYQALTKDTASIEVQGAERYFSTLSEHHQKAEGDTVLAQAIQQTKDMVLVTKSTYTMKTQQKMMQGLLTGNVNFDSLQTSATFFSKHAHGGMANLITEGTRDNVLTSELSGGLATCRTFAPQELINGKKELSFGAKIAEIYDPVKAKKFLERNKEVEYINYKGNFQKFTLIDHDQLFAMAQDSATEALKNNFEGKIVLLGFHGPTINTHSVEDKFYTPLNPRYIGKAEYDMFGIIVHANIISMILDETYINETPEWIEWIIGLLIAYLSIALFNFLYKKMDFWFDGLSLLIQFLFTILVIFATIQVFDVMRTRINLGLGLLVVVLAPNLIEIYFGVVTKIYQHTQKRIAARNKAQIHEASATDAADH